MNEGHDRRYLEWIRDSIQRIFTYRRDNPNALLEDGPIRDAIVWRLETIAEATTHLSEPLRARHPTLRWLAIRGFRNVAAHGYLSVKPERVQEVVDHDLAPLLAMVDQELA